LARSVAPALHYAVGQDNGIHGARAGTADGFDFDPTVFE
jgi:hypothetical protein